MAPAVERTVHSPRSMAPAVERNAHSPRSMAPAVERTAQRLRLVITMSNEHVHLRTTAQPNERFKPNELPIKPSAFLGSSRQETH